MVNFRDFANINRAFSLSSAIYIRISYFLNGGRRNFAASHCLDRSKKFFNDTYAPRCVVRKPRTMSGVAQAPTHEFLICAHCRTILDSSASRIRLD